MKGYPSNKGTLNKSWVVEDESPTWFGKSDLFTPSGVQFPSPFSTGRKSCRHFGMEKI